MLTETTNPQEIEARSFEIITEILGERVLPPKNAHIIKRCIHTSADFDYADNLYFSENAVEIIKAAIESGCTIVTDTQMAKAGINKAALQKLGGNVECYIADEDVAEEAKRRGVTRSSVAVEKAAKLEKPVIFAIGNAPTALIQLDELMREGYAPIAIIAVPVGFVNVVEAKELIVNSSVPCIVARGRKGGSNIAAAIVNAVLYDIAMSNGIAVL